jgi:uncharacterized membrane protein YhhN
MVEMGEASLVLAGLALVAALLYGLRHAAAEEKGAAGAAVKTASTGLLAMTLALQPGAEWFWLILLGLGLGALGDLCLALKGERMFLAGVGAFGLGHLAYAGGILLRSAALGFDGISVAEAVALAVLLALVLSTEVWLAPRTGGLRGPVRAYVGLIGAMGLAAILIPVAPGQGLLRSGAALFVLSDLMLAVQMFVLRDPGVKLWMSLALWPAYWAGQALIAWGAVVYWGAGHFWGAGQG